MAKFQLFLAFLKVSSKMGALWINLLTPTWLFGSAAVGCYIYTFFYSILKVALYLFQRKNKEESKANLISVDIYQFMFLLTG